MKIWIFSDVHAEFGTVFNVIPPADADFLICAGDILTKGIVPSIDWLVRNIADSMPVIFVAGNHELYGSSLTESIKSAREAAARHPNLHFLENDVVDIGDVSIVGATLWTDFRLFGRDPALVMDSARTGMNDYKRIKFSKFPYQRLRPIHAFRKHQESKNFFAAALRDRGEQKTVVVSHHAPSARSIASELRDDNLSGCYASDLESLITDNEPTLWVHGHVHSRSDYTIAGTRIVCNPMGYPGENTGFDATLVVDI